MKASEMTNEELAERLGGIADVFSNEMREAAARLRDYERGFINAVKMHKEYTALRHRLKVAEDALELTKNAMCNYCRSTPEAKGLPCLNDCETLAIAKEALAAIREETKTKGE